MLHPFLYFDFDDERADGGWIVDADVPSDVAMEEASDDLRAAQTIGDPNFTAKIPVGLPRRREFHTLLVGGLVFFHLPLQLVLLLLRVRSFDQSWPLIDEGVKLRIPDHILRLFHEETSLSDSIQDGRVEFLQRGHQSRILLLKRGRNDSLNFRSPQYLVDFNLVQV